MRDRDLQAHADALVGVVADLFADYSDWYVQLCEFAKVGFGSGGNGSRFTGVADPTFATVVSRDEVRRERKAHDQDMRQLASLLARLGERKAWVVARAPNREWIVRCERCKDEISGKGTDVQRQGLCPKCWGRAYRRERREEVQQFGGRR